MISDSLWFPSCFLKLTRLNYTTLTSWSSGMKCVESMCPHNCPLFVVRKLDSNGQWKLFDKDALPLKYLCEIPETLSLPKLLSFLCCIIFAKIVFENLLLFVNPKSDRFLLWGNSLCDLWVIGLFWLFSLLLSLLRNKYRNSPVNHFICAFCQLQHWHIREFGMLVDTAGHVVGIVLLHRLCVLISYILGS